MSRDNPGYDDRRQTGSHSNWIERELGGRAGQRWLYDAIAGARVCRIGSLLVAVSASRRLLGIGLLKPNGKLHIF